MTKSLLQQVMIKQEKAPVHSIDVAGLTEKIQSGYTVNRIDKHTQKKTFAPSTIAYGHGECPRYWYLAFDRESGSLAVLAEVSFFFIPSMRAQKESRREPPSGCGGLRSMP